jgi:glutamate--cysteine ligase
VIIQEGVPTRETVPEATAEPVVYMIDRYVVGGFYRINQERGIDENLNAPGMRFVPLAQCAPFDASCNLPETSADAGTCAPNRFYSYGVVARLALAAAAIELERTSHLLPPTGAAAN